MVSLLYFSKSTLAKCLINFIIADDLRTILDFVLDWHNQLGVSSRLLNIIELHLLINCMEH